MDDSVSVIIPAYNRATLIVRALDSVLAQTRAVDETIVVDDGSTDDTARVVANYRNRGVQYVRKENGGASSARNLGLDLARGTLIAFLDSDDEWRPEKNERQLRMLKGTPEAALCFCDSTLTGDGEVVAVSMNWDGRKVAFGPRLGISKGWSGYIPPGQFRRAQMWMNLVGMNEAVVRAEVFRQCGRFDSRFDPVEDYEMWLRASRRYGACYLDEPLAFIHSQRTSLTRQPELQERFRRNTLRVFHSELAVEQDPDMATMLRERIRAWWESEMGLALKEGQARRVVAICREAWRNGWRPDGHTRKIIRLASKMPRLATCLGRFC